MAPGTTQYVLGAPLFKKATLHFENGKNLVINAPENSDKNIYIESMSFNGVNYTKNYLDHNELLKGGVLDIKMGDKPNLNRGVNPEDFPYSFSVDEKKKKINTELNTKMKLNKKSRHLLPCWLQLFTGLLRCRRRSPVGAEKPGRLCQSLYGKHQSLAGAYLSDRTFT